MWAKAFSVFFFVVFSIFSGVFAGAFLREPEGLQAAREKLLASALSCTPPLSSQENLYLQSSRVSDQAESIELALIQENTIISLSSPNTYPGEVLAGLTFEGMEGEENSREIKEYIVEKGDTLKSVADKFRISADTITWANNGIKTLKSGQEILILPVSGVIHYVKNGDTLEQIASKYKGSLSETISFNELKEENDIYVGDFLVIPGGKMPVVKNNVSYAATPSQIPVANSYFICPTSSCRKTQGLHWYNAVDFSEGRCGAPIFAAAAGTVQSIRYGYNFGAGNTISILHPNGLVTSYGHIKSAAVGVGQKVSQGQVIAYIGGTPGTYGAGISTGCHVHFAVHGASNPFR